METYVSLLIDQYLPSAIEGYMRNRWHVINISIDNIEVIHLYEDMQMILGDEADLIRLNELFSVRFLAASNLHLLYQVATNGLIQAMIQHDPETSQPISKLLLNA